MRYVRFFSPRATPHLAAAIFTDRRSEAGFAALTPQNASANAPMKHDTLTPQKLRTDFTKITEAEARRRHPFLFFRLAREFEVRKALALYAQQTA